MTTKYTYIRRNINFYSRNYVSTFRFTNVELFLTLENRVFHNLAIICRVAENMAYISFDVFDNKMQLKITFLF